MHAPSRNAVQGVAVCLALGLSLANSGANYLNHKDVTATQHQVAVSQKASTHTRVTTVTQRCDLTNLLISIVGRLGDTLDAPALQKSWAGCEVQLVEVKRIDAITPNPNP